MGAFLPRPNSFGTPPAILYPPNCLSTPPTRHGRHDRVFRWRAGQGCGGFAERCGEIVAKRQRGA